MVKKSRKVSIVLIIVGIVLFLILLGVMFFYFSLVGKNYDESYVERTVEGELVNPAVGLSLEEAVAKFDESFIHYLLVSIKAYNLHKSPLSTKRPRIEFLVDDVAFNAEVVKGKIIVGRGEIDEKDVTLRTSIEEVVKMVQNKEYIKESFSSGKSSIELVENKSTLFAKGYLKIYTELTGESIT